jgi:hypothetical protein
LIKNSNYFVLENHANFDDGLNQKKITLFKRKRLYASCIDTSIVHESRKQHHAANGRHMPFDPRAFVCLVASTHGCGCSCLASIACMCPLPRSRALDASICAKPSSCACFTLGKTDRFAVKPSIFRKKPFRYRRVLERTVGHQQLAKKAQL